MDPSGAVTDIHATAGLGDQCSNCGAQLAGDQRYCLACGEPRASRPRPAAATSVPATPAPAAVTTVQRASRASTGPTLIAGIGTLLLAMGVGVLIGRSSQKTESSNRAAAPVQVVTVAGGGGTAAAATAKAPKLKTPKKSAQKAAAAKAKADLAKTLGGGNVPPKAVVKVGDKGHGPGYQHGKFTGNFFGG